jgi:hypothetical protein
MAADGEYSGRDRRLKMLMGPVAGKTRLVSLAVLERYVPVRLVPTRAARGQETWTGFGAMSRDGPVRSCLQVPAGPPAIGTYSACGVSISRPRADLRLQDTPSTRATASLLRERPGLRPGRS